MELCRVLQKPIITEKSAGLSEDGRYVFQVNLSTNKVEVKQAFKELYGIEPEKVNTYYTAPKTSSRRGLKRKRTKRALVILPAGKTVDLVSIKK